MRRLAIAAAGCALMAVATGAMVTSSGDAKFGQLHQITGGIAAGVVSILAIRLTLKENQSLGLTLLGMVAGAIATGIAPQRPVTGILHALWAPLLLAVTVTAVVLTGSASSNQPDLVEDHGWPSLRSLGDVTLAFVILQIALGAGFRHKALGVLPHLFDAMVLVLLILCLCIFVMQQFPTHKALRPSANLLMAIAFTQIFLGIAAFTARTITSKVTPAVVAITAAHATVGALTLAAAGVLNLQIRRNVFRKEPSE